MSVIGVEVDAAYKQQQRIDTTTQQIKNCMVAALTECGLVEASPITATERQAAALRTIYEVGARAVVMLSAMSIDSSKVKPIDAGWMAHNLNAVLDAMRKEFAL